MRAPRCVPPPWLASAGALRPSGSTVDMACAALPVVHEHDRHVRRDACTWTRAAPLTFLAFAPYARFHSHSHLRPPAYGAGAGASAVLLPFLACVYPGPLCNATPCHYRRAYVCSGLLVAACTSTACHLQVAAVRQWVCGAGPRCLMKRYMQPCQHVPSSSCNSVQDGADIKGHKNLQACAAPA